MPKIIALLEWSEERAGCILEVLRKRERAEREGELVLFHLDVNDRKRVRCSFKKSPKGHSSEREESFFFFLQR